MEALFIGGLLFAGVGLYELADEPGVPSAAMAVVGLGLIALAFGVGRIYDRQRGFANWLRAHSADIGRGNATWYGEPIEPHTELVFVTMVTSSLIVSGERRIGPFLASDPTFENKLLVINAVTAVFGWWSLLGIVRTPMALTSNSNGGQRITVADYLSHGEASLDPLG